MAEFVINYDREAQAFGSIVIRAEFVKPGSDDEVGLHVKDFTVTPKGVIDVVTDPSSTETVAVLRAKLADEVARDERVLDRVKSPVTVRITAVPLAEQTMSLISVEPVEVTQSCTIRVDVTGRINECDELGARLERLIERRIRLREQFQGGVDALYRAFANEEKMERSYAELETQHLVALGLLGTAAVGATLALGHVAATAYAFATHLSQTIVLVGEYGGVIVGMQGEVRATQLAYTAVTRGYATAAASVTGAVAAPTTWEVIRQKMNAGLTEAKAGMATAVRMREGLSKASGDLRVEIDALERDISYTRSRMRGCPDVKVMNEPPERLPEIPTLADWNVPHM